MNLVGNRQGITLLPGSDLFSCRHGREPGLFGQQYIRDGQLGTAYWQCEYTGGYLSQALHLIEASDVTGPAATNRCDWPEPTRPLAQSWRGGDGGQW